MDSAITEKVISIINENVKNANITIENQDALLQNFGMNSIAFIQIIVALEEEFECEIPDSQLLLSELNTISKIVNVIEPLIESDI